MKRTNFTQKGFAVVELAIIIGVVALVGVLGYMYVNRQVDAPQAVVTSQDAREQTTSIRSELDTIDIEQELDTSTIDEVLE